MNKLKHKLTLYQSAIYRIKVPGELGENWSNWGGGMTIAIERKHDGNVVTTLTGDLDQAALQGLLRQLYSLGLPLISVQCIET